MSCTVEMFGKASGPKLGPRYDATRVDDDMLRATCWVVLGVLGYESGRVAGARAGVIDPFVQRIADGTGPMKTVSVIELTGSASVVIMPEPSTRGHSLGRRDTGTKLGTTLDRVVTAGLLFLALARVRE